MKPALAGTLFAMFGLALYAQSAEEQVHLDPPVPTGPPTNSAPNPYRTISGWFKLPEGRTFGSTGGVAIDKRGHIWVAERCGSKGFIAGACADSKLDPIFEFDEAGKLLHNFGGGLMVMPHGISIDADGNVWVTDIQGKEGKGHQVFKFSPGGKVLMTLGTAGVAGSGPTISINRQPLRSLPTATCSSRKGMAAKVATRSRNSRKKESSSRPGARKESRPANSTCLTA